MNPVRHQGTINIFYASERALNDLAASQTTKIKRSLMG